MFPAWLLGHIQYSLWHSDESLEKKRREEEKTESSQTYINLQGPPVCCFMSGWPLLCSSWRIWLEQVSWDLWRQRENCFCSSLNWGVLVPGRSAPLIFQPPIPYFLPSPSRHSVSNSLFSNNSKQEFSWLVMTMSSLTIKKYQYLISFFFSTSILRSVSFLFRVAM